MQSMRRGALAVLAVLATAGCGAANTKPGLTKAQFIAQADAICRAEDEKLHRAAELSHASIASFGDVPRLIRQAVAIHEATNAELESLTEPPGQVATIGKWLTARTVAATVESDAAQALAEELSTARNVQEERKRTSALARALAHNYGFNVCGPIE
jgi:hypothetical protein